MRRGNQNRKLSTHIFKSTQEIETKLKVEQGYGLSKFTLTEMLPPEKPHLLSFYHLCHQLEPSMQIFGAYGDSHPNHHTLLRNVKLTI